MKRVLLLLVMVACGGSAPPETAPSSGGGASAPQMATPESTMHTNTNDPGNTRGINAARNDLDNAESRVNAATSDCATACRALESMERAAEHLCALDGGTECGRARHRLEAARDRVRASCGGCR